MKHHMYSVMMILTAALTLISCDKNEEEEKPILSYFRGMENDMPINIEQNVDYDARIKPHSSIRESSGRILSYNFTFSLDQGNGLGNLDVMLAPLRMGLYKIPAVDILFFSGFESQVAVFLDGKTYQPHKNPFIIAIDYIDPTLETSFPHIKGRMEGVLYNGKNLKDSITFKNVEFRVW